MRTKSAQATAVLANPSHSARAIVTVYNADGSVGVVLDSSMHPATDPGPSGVLAEPVLEVEVSQDIDSFRTAKVTLQRQQGLWSLAPLVDTGNPLHDNVEPIVFVHRRIVIEAELVLADISATPAGLRETIFDGWVDEIAWPDDDLLLICTDKSAELRDTWIEEERIYGYAQGAYATRGLLAFRYDLHALQVGELVCPSKDQANGHFYRVTAASSAQSAAEPTWPTGSGSTVVSGGVTFTESGAVDETGTDLETIIEQVLADNGLSAITLAVPVSPGWLVKPFIQQRESVMDALQAMVDQLGWYLRFEWGGSAYELTLAEPDRSSVTVHKVLDQVEEEDCSELGLAVWDIRNVVRVIYGDSSSRDPTGAPTRITREVSDSTSIATYGRRFMEVAEADGSMIDTSTEADQLANAILSDLKDPVIKTAYSFPIDFYLELGDRIQLPADTLRFSSAQVLATSSLTHHFKGEHANTSVTLRGRPAAHHSAWLSMDGRANPGDIHARSQFQAIDVAPLVVTPVVGGQRFTIKSDQAKGALAQAYEVHVSDTPGFTPSAATMKTHGQATSVDVPDLVGGKTYYAKTVSTLRNASRIVRGEPSAETPFVAGRAKAAHYDSLATQSHLPLNGNFEHTSDDVTLAPPDHWSVVALGGETESYGPSGSVYSAVDSNKGRIINLRAHASQRGRLLSSPFEVRRGVRGFNIYLSIRRLTGSGSGSPYDLLLDVFGYSDSAMSPLITNYTVTLSGSGSGPYPSLSTWYEAVVKFGADYSTIPTNVNFIQLALRRSTAGSTAVGWDIGDVYVQESDFSHAIIDQPAWVAPTHATNWGDNGGGWMPAGYFKDSMGVIHVRGLVKITTGTLTAPIWTFPSGFRPTAGTHQFPVRCGDGTLSYISLGTDGVLNFGGTLAQGQAALMTEFTFDTR